MTKASGAASLFLGVVLGISVCALLIWNPLGWTRIDHFLGRASEAHQAMDHPDGTLYTCGMHLQVVQDEPGNCPICGMRLVPIADTGSGRPSGERKILYWRAPMDPSYTSDQPGKSPMGMDLVPVYEDEGAVDGGVRVSQNFLQNFAVRTTEVRQGSLPIEIETVGILSHDEERVISINTKFEGWIENARVNNIGEHVKKGDLLFEIYSPQLVTTQREYLAAIEYVDRLTEKGAYPEAIERAKSLREAAHERLRYWDMTEEQIEALDKSRTVSRTVEFISPASGSVVGKMGNSFEGMKVSPGMTLLKLAHHATLWVEAEFYEQDIRHLREGQRVTIEVDAFPGRRWSGKILFFRPAVSPHTRTLTAFIQVANEDLKLLPQMYARIRASVGGQSNTVIVPDQSVLHSGERAVVIVAKGGGLFEPREVDLGIASGGMQQVTRGLSSGEQVVTSSQFLIDSESNLRAAISQLLGDGGGKSGETPSMPASHQH